MAQVGFTATRHAATDVRQPALARDRFTFTAPATTGVHAYHCEVHAFMRGTLTVSDLTLTADGRVPAGRGAHLTGVAPGAAAGTAVVVERRVAGAWLPYAAAVTDAAGGYSVMTPALAAGVALRARAGERTSPALRIAPVPPSPFTGTRVADVRVNPHGPVPAPVGAARPHRLPQEHRALPTRDTWRRIIAPLRAPGVYPSRCAAGGNCRVTARGRRLPYD